MRTDRVEFGPKFSLSGIETQIALAQRANPDKHVFSSKLRYFLIKTTALVGTAIGLNLLFTHLSPFDLSNVAIGGLLTFAGGYVFKNFKLSNFYS